MAITIEQFAHEMKVKKESRRARVIGFINSLQPKKAQVESPVDIKAMRSLVHKVYRILPHLEGPVNDTYDKQPRVFFGSQQEFEDYTKDRPAYWNDDRVKKVYKALAKMDYTDKKFSALVAIKKIFLP